VRWEKWESEKADIKLDQQRISIYKSFRESVPINQSGKVYINQSGKCTYQSIRKKYLSIRSLEVHYVPLKENKQKTKQVNTIQQYQWLSSIVYTKTHQPSVTMATKLCKCCLYNNIHLVPAHFLTSSWQTFYNIILYWFISVQCNILSQLYNYKFLKKVSIQ